MFYYEQGSCEKKGNLNAQIIKIFFMFLDVILFLDMFLDMTKNFQYHFQSFQLIQKFNSDLFIVSFQNLRFFYQ